MCKKKGIVESYSRRLLEIINERRTPNLKRTYGFEYEFIPEVVPHKDFISEIKDLLFSVGFENKGEVLKNRRGTVVSFEPGGQIEFHSSALLADDTNKLLQFLQDIEETISEIYRLSGIRYIATPYIPNREDAPLCITSERYINLHKRFEISGTRGHEMMKGTASIHMHASILNTEELPRLFAKFLELSEAPEFRMGPDRRDIFLNTDPTRCGNLIEMPEKQTNSLNFIRDYVNTALNAVVLGTDKPFYQIHGTTFEDFLYHLTTIFTDVRLNFTVLTVELRTLDSMSYDLFVKRWKRFVAELESL